MIQVQVTQTDIAYGYRYDRKRCPIACAIITATGEAFNVEVFGTHVNIGGKAYWLPAIAREFLERFDRLKDVQPINFQLDHEKPRELHHGY